MIERRVLRVRGEVQGVGFRPFVYREAQALGLRGGVWNEPDAAVIDVEGDAPGVAELVRILRSRPPPRCRIESVEQLPAAPFGAAPFEIRASRSSRVARVRVAPDLATCAACFEELRDADDRRFGYAFANCTDCGPRYSIVRDVPYDRARTTMSAFRMCDACAAEYGDAASRRFHAQPNACPACGPRVWLEPVFGDRDAPPIVQAARALREGRVVALKGLGGFHLACDARSAAAVRRLRARKHRPAKPFAVMFPDLEALESEALVDRAARAALRSTRAPIALLPRRADSRLAPDVAPGLREVGAFLPYTPLHHLLLRAFGAPLVMTSGNRSDEPLAASNEEARERLSPLADHLLLHDREIHARVDDSVVRVSLGRERVLRRARGLVPEVFDLGFEAPPILAVGADLKNALCLAADGAAVVGPHVGDLGSFEARRLFEETRRNLSRLFGIEPSAVAHDLHPAYHGTALARESGLPRIPVAHHHAHVASCLVENRWRGPAIGVAWDGAGFGEDGTVWGGEFLVASLAGYERHARLRPVPLPGGDAAVREPWRMALSHLLAAGLPVDRIEARDRDAVVALIRRGRHAPLASSAGRLFDAVAALLGACARASYEGQAAAELEALSRPGEDPYPLPVGAADASRECDARQGLLELDARPLVRAVVADLERGVDPPRIGGRFHAALAQGILETCRRIRDRTGTGAVALTGGCFQNPLLTRLASDGLERAGFRVLLHARIPPGDGGIALGQVAVASWRNRRVSRHSG